MKITLNGQPRDLNGVADVPSLLAMLDVRLEQVAVAINGEVIRRDDWRRTALREGDAVEVVRAVGGGALR